MSEVILPILTDLQRCDCYTFSATVPPNPRFASVVNVYIGDGSDFPAKAVFIGQIPATPGDYSFDFTYPETGSFNYEDIILTDGTGAINQLQNIEINLQSSCANTYCSECYQLSDCPNASGCNTTDETGQLLLQWTNDENGLGFNYSQLGFIQQLRVKGGLRIMTGTYDDETYYTTSNGVRGLLYTHAKEQQEMWVNSVPEYIHKALRIGLAHDHFFINGIEYVKTEGGYNPDWDVPNTLKAPVAIGIEKKTQDTFNQNC